MAASRSAKGGPYRSTHRAEEAGTRLDNERYHDIVEVMKNAAAVDPAATDILQQSDTGYRQALGQISRRLRALEALKVGPSEGRAPAHHGHRPGGLLEKSQMSVVTVE